MFKKFYKAIARKRLAKLEKEVEYYEEMSEEQFLQVNPERINNLYISAAMEILELQNDIKNHPIITRIKELQTGV